MKTREPLGKKMVPAGDHREARVGREVEAERRKIVGEQKKNGDGHQGMRETKAAQSIGQGLRDGSDEVDVIRRNEGQYGGGSENIKKCDKRSSQKNGSREVPRGIARFSCKYGRVFESA